MASWDDEDFGEVNTTTTTTQSAPASSWDEEDFQPSWEKPTEVKTATDVKPPPQPKPKPGKQEKKEPEKPLSSEERSQLKKDAEVQKKLADYDNAVELFKGVDTSNNKKKNQLAEDQIEILVKLEPGTKEEFAKFSAAIVARVRKHEESLHYAPTIKELCKALCSSDKLDSSDISEIVKSLNVIVNDKLKAEKAPKKGMKKTAAKKKVAVPAKKDIDEEDDIDEDVTAGPRGQDDYDDFM